jgi:hypothetical protein
MKNSTLITLALCFCFCRCQKGLKVPTLQEKTQAAMIGKWKLRQVTDRFHKTYTDDDPCIADDTFEFTEQNATLSQGNCIEFPDKPQNITFQWKFVSEDLMDMGGDTVRVTLSNDTALSFKRDDPEFLEYHWYRNK